MVFRKTITFEDIEGDIPESVRAVLLDMERAGFTILMKTKIEDTRLKDGNRRRTFRLAGKYDLCLALKDLGDIQDIETEAAQLSARFNAAWEEQGAYLEESRRAVRNLKDKLGRRDTALENIKRSFTDLETERDAVRKRVADLEVERKVTAEDGDGDGDADNVSRETGEDAATED